MYDGTIVAIIDDFLGVSIVLEHKLPDLPGTFLSIYGHVVVRQGLHAGIAVREAENIGTLIDPGTSRSDIYPHLHLSLARPSGTVSPDRLSWRALNDPGLFTMMDPLAVIGGPHRVIERINEDPEPA